MTYRQIAAPTHSVPRPAQHSGRSARRLGLSACFLIVAGAASGANGFTFSDVDSEDAQAIETFLETATTDAENSLPSGRGTMMIVDTHTDPAICREFVVNLSDVGQKSASGCRTGSGSWALADGNNTLGGEQLMIPPPGSRPEVSSNAPVPARLAGVPTIDIPQMALTPPQPQIQPEPPSVAPPPTVSDAPSGETAPSTADEADSDNGDAVAADTEAAPPIVAPFPSHRPETGPETGRAGIEDDSQDAATAVPAQLAGFPSPEPRPSPPPSRPAESPADPEMAAATEADSESEPSSGTADAPLSAQAEPPTLNPVPERLTSFPQPQPKPST